LSTETTKHEQKWQLGTISLQVLSNYLSLQNEMKTQQMTL